MFRRNVVPSRRSISAAFGNIRENLCTPTEGTSSNARCRTPNLPPPRGNCLQRGTQSGQGEVSLQIGHRGGRFLPVEAPWQSRQRTNHRADPSDGAENENVPQPPTRILHLSRRAQD